VPVYGNGGIAATPERRIEQPVEYAIRGFNVVKVELLADLGLPSVTLLSFSIYLSKPVRVRRRPEERRVVLGSEERNPTLT
jgi:hypothetical protein